MLDGVLIVRNRGSKNAVLITEKGISRVEAYGLQNGVRTVTYGVTLYNAAVNTLEKSKEREGSSLTLEALKNAFEGGSLSIVIAAEVNTNYGKKECVLRVNLSKITLSVVEPGFLEENKPNENYPQLGAMRVQLHMLKEFVKYYAKNAKDSANRKKALLNIIDSVKTRIEPATVTATVNFPSPFDEYMRNIKDALNIGFGYGPENVFNVPWFGDDIKSLSDEEKARLEAMRGRQIKTQEPYTDGKKQPETGPPSLLRMGRQRGWSLVTYSAVRYLEENEPDKAIKEIQEWLDTGD